MCVADLDVTHAVLNLLYTFTKRSTYLTRLNQDTRKRLISQLTYLADSWGGKGNSQGQFSSLNFYQKMATAWPIAAAKATTAKSQQQRFTSTFESKRITKMSKIKSSPRSNRSIFRIFQSSALLWAKLWKSFLTCTAVCPKIFT